MAVMLEWSGGERFRVVTESGVEIAVDGRREAGVSPMEALLVALAACMGTDIVDILAKGRQDVSACTIRASGERRERPPRRYTSVTLAIELAGRGLSRGKVERAVELSRATYCSVWHSLASDIDLAVELALRET